MESTTWLNIYLTDDSTVSVQTVASMFHQLEPPFTTHTVQSDDTECPLVSKIKLYEMIKNLSGSDNIF